MESGRTTRLAYPVDVHEHPGQGYIVIFQDMPEAGTFGPDRHIAFSSAVDRLSMILAGLVKDRADIPEPSVANGRPTVSPRVIVAAKVLLYIEMQRANIKPAELARMMGVFRQETTRLLDPGAPSKIEGVERALAALGKRLSVSVD